MIKKKLISLVDNSCVKCLGHVVPEENPGADTGYAVENASVGCLRNSLVSFYKNRGKVVRAKQALAFHLRHCPM